MSGEKKYKILIVDDDSFLLDMYALKFNQSGFDVHTSLSADEALKKLKDGVNPDVLLLDIVMPVMNGFELMEKMNNEQIVPSCIRIVLSNRGQQNDILRGQELGAAGYIVKANTTPSEVITKVMDIVETQKHK